MSVELCRPRFDDWLLTGRLDAWHLILVLMSSSPPVAERPCWEGYIAHRYLEAREGEIIQVKRLESSTEAE